MEKIITWESPSAAKGIYSGVESVDFKRKAPGHKELFDFLIQEEYPSLFGEFPGGQSFILREEKGIVAHAGFVVREYQHPLFRIKIGLIGSVVTHRDYRGMGYVIAVLREVLAELRRQG